jgi:hypothetical protein
MVDWRFYSLDMLPVNNTRGSKFGSRGGFRVAVDGLGDGDEKRLLKRSGCRGLGLMRLA